MQILSIQFNKISYTYWNSSLFVTRTYVYNTYSMNRIIFSIICRTHFKHPLLMESSSNSTRLIPSLEMRYIKLEFEPVLRFTFQFRKQTNSNWNLTHCAKATIREHGLVSEPIQKIWNDNESNVHFRDKKTRYENEVRQQERL